MTIDQALTQTVKQLKTLSVAANPHLEAEILLSKIIGQPREFALTHPNKKLTPSQSRRLTSLVNRRAKGEPIAYLIGEKEFYGLNFKVNKNVLVPRPETELIVDEALNLILKNKKTNSPFTIIDVGTGSGCIIIALAKKLAHQNLVKNFSFFASDISPAAIKVAQINARRHQLIRQIKFSVGDLIKPFAQILAKLKPDSNLIILANLPYLTPAQIKTSGSIQTEPRLALDGGQDGLKYYRQLFTQIKKFKLSTNFKVKIIAEIDPGQKKNIKNLTLNTWPDTKPKFRKDLAGFTRIVIISDCLKT